MRPSSLAVLLLAALALAALPAAAEPPAVVRAHFTADGEPHTAATLFLLAAPHGGGIVAVGTAHSFDLAALVRATDLELRTARRGRRVARASRLLAPPGRPFSAPGASLRDDLVIFALDTPPHAARVLEAATDGLPPPRTRVRILGIPATIPQDEDDLFGTVRAATAERLEIELDVKADLRGWGGAPVLRADDGRVVGLLQAAWPSGGTLRLAATPIDAVLEALARPLDGGRGRPFAAFSDAVARGAAAAGPGGAAPGGGPTSDRSSAAARARPATPGTARRPTRSAAERAAAPRPVLRQGREGPQPIVLQIEHPADGAIVGDELGAFVAGRAVAPRGDFRRIDVMVVIDTSGSTREPTGVDVNGNGVVGEAHLGALGGLFELGSTDPGDSILAAEVASARALLRNLDPRSTRVGLVTFAGEPDEGGLLRRTRPAAITEVPLTTDYTAVERALDRILERGARGSTHMAAGVDQATIELLGLRGASSRADPESEKVTLFLTDGRPTLPYGAGAESANTRAVLRAADRAARAGIHVHPFGIGHEALEGPVALVELARRTEGIFTPVRHPGTLMDVVEQVDFANLESLEVVNRTTGRAAETLVRNADGSFGALVPLRAGRNRIEVAARASDGSEARTAITVQYAPGAPEAPVPPVLALRRSRLLEQRLIELKRSRIALERDQAEQARKELLVEIERERAAATDRAARQRKELELEVEGEPEP